MRYTEARFAKAGEALLADIDKETVDFQPNYDESREPLVLPARFPNLLVNGAGGIAVGMATNIPPHNLGEVIDACLAYLETRRLDRPADRTGAGAGFPDRRHHPGPVGIRSAYHTGHGSIVMRAKTFIEERGKDRQSIIVSEIPVPGEQVAPGRAHRRGGQRQKRRGHFRPARRIRPRRRAHRHGAEARRDARGRAGPALPLHAAADLVRRQHAGADRRPAADDER
jgi:hypothetical protein